MEDEPISIYVTKSVEETKQVAAALTAALRTGDVVVLNGGLGAGKTHFVQGVAEALGIVQPVTSPTFNILQTYEGASLAINHFDLYRLESEEELDDIGFFETLEGGAANFIEWGDKFPECMPSDYLEVSITANDKGARVIQAQSCGPRSEVLLADWAENAS